MDDLKMAMSAHGRINLVAWLVRNLLELAYWTSYCAQSVANSQKFGTDAARDLMDLMNVPDGIFSETFSFMAARQEAIDNAKAEGFESIDEKYTKVPDVARGLGFGVEFHHTNKLLSKFAHPTALSVIYDREIPPLSEKFYKLGMFLGTQTIKLIDKSIASS